MDIWAIKHEGRFLVQFLSDNAKQWMHDNAYYRHLPLDATVSMDKGEYEELRDGLEGRGLTLFECSGKAH